MIFSQGRWATLWTITQAGTVTDERAAGIAGNLNPLQVNEYHTNILFAVRVTVKVDMTLTAVRLYGAGNANGFPPAPTAVEALWTTGTNIGVNQGVLRIAAGRNRDAAAVEVIVHDQLRLLPQFLLLEYSTAVAGAAPNIVFVVEACFLGPLPDGNE